MENLYLFVVIVLFALAITDLVVGVSNDAVNFLNSAIGAKVASFKLIMVIAALGVFVGATFSSGMMEVARKGIFNPQYFHFGEIMIIFLAVMITDVILLDGFNTLGMPTSTTVSIVFELLGAAVAISLVKIYNDNNALQLYEYINTSKALAIISGILLSVVVAFSVGALVQFLTRIVFSFNFQNRSSIVASIFGGFAIALITYFMLIKGAKGASFMSDEIKDWIKLNTFKILGLSFIGWTLLMQLMYWLFKFNVFKFIILIGTFALAMAFAGNDLVNFIGVPLAGFESFKNFMASGGTDPSNFLMVSMAGKVHTAPYLLVIAGLVMVIVLWTSKKAKSVVKTSIDLSRQDEGEERFGSSILGRAVVRFATNTSKTVDKVLPPALNNWMEKRFDDSDYRKSISGIENPPSFDLVRASVNLVVASVLIALGTSLKLPLSTTYVTFMVAMGTSLADRAWGRESAVYRVTGVFSVIGGWFLTALIAFTVAFIVALIINATGIYGIIVLVGTAGFIMYRTQIIHKNKGVAEEDDEVQEEDTLQKTVLKDSIKRSTRSIDRVIDMYCDTLDGLNNEDRKKLKDLLAEMNKLNGKVKKRKHEAIEKIKTSEVDIRETGLYYMHIYDNITDLTKVMINVVEPAFIHVDNNHKTFSEEQKAEMQQICNEFKTYASHCKRAVVEKDFDKLELIREEMEAFIGSLNKLNKLQFKRLKQDKAGTKISMLYLDVLNKSKMMAQSLYYLIKAQAVLVNDIEGEKEQ